MNRACAGLPRWWSIFGRLRPVLMQLPHYESFIGDRKIADRIASWRGLRSASRKRDDGAAQKVRVITCEKNGQPGLFPWFRQTT